VGTLWQDFRFCLRTLAKAPAFTTVAILSLALGIGANTAIFTLIDALLLRELPVRQPEQLVELYVKRLEGQVPFSYPMYRELSRWQRVFSDLMAWNGGSFSSVELNGTLSQATVVAVSGNYFTELGVTPLLGRLIAPEDANPQGGSTSEVAVIGYGFWQRRFGGAADVVGRQIRIEGHAFTIIGVTRKWFMGMTPGEPPEIVIPIAAQPVISPDSVASLDDRSRLWLSLTGRLKPGVTIAQARGELQSLWPGVLQATASTQEPGLRRQRFMSMRLEAGPATTGLSRDLRRLYTRPLYVLMGIVGLILLVACVNLASLMLARAAARNHETSIRRALGAGRWTLARQVLTETLTLSFAGALLGLACAWSSSRLLVNLMTRDSLAPIVLDLRPDWRVLCAAASAAVLTGILFALAPAWHASRQHPAALLQQNARTLAGGAGKLGKGLVVAQVALSFVLVMGAGLLVRTFQELSSIRLGFQQDHLLEVMLSPKPGGYQGVDTNAYHEQLLERLSAMPGVRSAGMGPFVPASEGWRDTVSQASASAETSRGTGLMAEATTVTPGFFDTMGMRFLRGRDFAWNDDDRHPAVAIVSRSLAERLFPGSAIGQRIRFGFMPEYQSLEVVGVVGDARLFYFRDAEKGADVVYLPTRQHGADGAGGTLAIRTGTSPEAIAPAVAREIASFGHEYALRMETIPQVMAQTLVPVRVTAALSAFFAGLALLLASIGLYGLMSYAVSRRTHEIGIRLALGAQRSRVRWMVLRETLALGLAGTAIGIPCALAGARLLASMLFGVTPGDVPTIAIALFLVLGVAITAGYLPARRAMRVHPIIALRCE
jgi:putative ABC transport system permease protein